MFLGCFRGHLVVMQCYSQSRWYSAGVTTQRGRFGGLGTESRKHSTPLLVPAEVMTMKPEASGEKKHQQQCG